MLESILSTKYSSGCNVPELSLLMESTNFGTIHGGLILFVLSLTVINKKLYIYHFLSYKSLPRIIASPFYTPGGSWPLVDKRRAANTRQA